MKLIFMVPMEEFGLRRVVFTTSVRCFLGGHRPEGLKGVLEAPTPKNATHVKHMQTIKVEEGRCGIQVVAWAPPSWYGSLEFRWTRGV